MPKFRWFVFLQKAVVMKAIQYFSYCCVLLLGLSLTACDQDKLETSAPSQTRAWDETLYFGVIPIESEARTQERYARFIHYLEKQLNSKIELVIPEDYAGVIEGLKQKKLHFALLGPKSYIEASKHANTMTAVRVIGEDGQDGYKGMIISKKGSGLKTIADLRGKTWAFTDPNSTSGNLIPSVYFAAEAQIVPQEFFSKVVFSGSHQNSILMVKKGEIDAAATNNVDIERDSGRQWHEDDFNVLWESQLIPHDMLAYRQDVPEALKHALIQAAVNYDDAQGLKDMAISKFIPSKDEDYIFVRQLAEFKQKLSQQKSE